MLTRVIPEGVPEPARALQARLMLRARGRRNEHAVACMLATWAHGGGALPARLGLAPRELDELLGFFFPGAALSVPRRLRGSAPDRDQERDDLRRLLLAHRAGACPSEIWIAEILVQGCMGDDHLWQDLGLWSRGQLSELMEANFPELAARNDRDMKWKKFLYRELCVAEGLSLCRAPSCEACVDYHECFGSEAR